LFKTYMPVQVADALMADPTRARPGGQRREVTILFADLEGFTALAERTPPEQVVDTLNVMLSTMAEVIIAHGGMVDKFMGDGVMAIFNAPLDQPDHAYQALQAAIEIQRRVAAQVVPAPLRVNLGVYTGEAVVGNVGGAHLLNYTAIGDAVNLAKRLQEMAHGGQILTSAETLARACGIVGHALGEQLVQGRQAAVKIYLVNSKEPQ
jgi:adenylate cyclase